jgi:hypothetical protein
MVAAIRPPDRRIQLVDRRLHVDRREASLAIVLADRLDAGVGCDS